jgi:hypothetical protein
LGNKHDNVTIIALAVIGLLGVGLVIAGGLFALALAKNGTAALPGPSQPQPVPIFQDQPLQEAPFIPVQDLPTVYTAPVRMLTYERGVRGTINRTGRQFITWRSPFTGTLVGLTVLTSSIDTGDTYGVLLNGRTIKDTTYPVSGVATGGDFSEPITAGDTMTLYYDSQGSTVKNIDLTPRVQYSPSQNPGV